LNIPNLHLGILPWKFTGPHKYVPYFVLLIAQSLIASRYSVSQQPFITVDLARLWTSYV